MMISDKLAEAMSLQVGREIAASNQYIVIAAYFEREMLDKLAGFFYRQAAEEHEHAMKFVHYVTGAGGEVGLPAVEALDRTSPRPKRRPNCRSNGRTRSPPSGAMDQAVKENDYLAQDFLRWFINEQLEEVTTMEALLKVIQRAGPNGLLFVNPMWPGEALRTNRTGAANSPAAHALRLAAGWRGIRCLLPS